MLSRARKQRNATTLGQMIRGAREKHGFTQKALADAIGLEYYTMISQMELGYVAIPPALWVPLCDKLRLETKAFVMQCLTEYHPEIFKAVFGNKSREEASALLVLFEKGKLDALIEGELQCTKH